MTALALRLTHIREAAPENGIPLELPSHDDVVADIDAIVAGFELQRIRRFFKQIHWAQETECANKADQIESGVKLENVAAHSWHVADCVLLLVGHFAYLDQKKSIELALLHDKLELITGDFDPVGPDGQGGASHAFSRDHQLEKVKLERMALDVYISRLRPRIRAEQASLLNEFIEGLSDEAQFVSAIDKLQALVFVLVKKNGQMSNDHLEFTIRYSFKCVEYFPPIRTHYEEVLQRILRRVADVRGCRIVDIFEGKI